MKYTEDHEWLDKDDNVLVVGITEHASIALGDIVFIELPAVGQYVDKDEEICVIESVKAASDILAPLSGKIVEVNSYIVDNPNVVNEDPTGSWFFKIIPDDMSEYDSFMNYGDYVSLIS